MIRFFNLNKNIFISFIISLIFLFFSFLSIKIIKYYRAYQSLPSEHLVGNKNSNVQKLEKEGFPFSFLVIGDIERSEKGEVLIKKALKNGRFSFLILLGDVVRKPDIWEHRFFLTDMVTEIKPPFPVFIVPGNHDIDYTSKKIKHNERRVTQKVFDFLYGARSFDFIFNHCLFILLEVDPRNPNGYLNYLHEVLAKKGEGKKYIFVFIHFPPKGFGALKDFLPNEDQFFSILERYKVTTCFFGHYHGYRRGQRKGVNLVVAGGGGRLKKTQSEWGKFHHILKVSVDEHIISENLIVLEKGIYFEKSFENWVFTHLFPIVEDRGWILYIGAILFFWGGVYFLIYFIVSVRNKNKKKP
ncbi:MAG: metallophosphoesterase family protein [Bacteroidales bacterium]